MLEAVSPLVGGAAGTLVIGTLPPPLAHALDVDRAAIDRLRASWRTRLVEMGAEQVDFAAIVEEMGAAAAAQSDLEVVARAPYSPRLYQELGIVLARQARRSRTAPVKAIALDADGVLWGGVLAEDTLEGIHIGPDHPGRAYEVFQRQLLRWKERGVLLVLVSRNSEEDVWQVFEEHPGMVLRRQDIAAWRINWQSKSQNLRELAQELNLGLDAFLFLDDDPGNRLEVEAHAPEVTVVPLPTDPALYVPTLARLWCFDTTATTGEDRARPRMMLQERERRQERAATGNLATYLESLQLTARMRRATRRDLPRVAQLTQKTNQFNLSRRRRGVAELKALRSQADIYVVEASDRFGDYGLIGSCVLARAGDGSQRFELDTFLLSCRALARGIEEAVLFELVELVRLRGGKHLIAPYVAGPRNQPIQAFLQRLGWHADQDCLWLDVDAMDMRCPAHLAWSGPASSQEPSESSTLD